ncbi:bifunctional 5,10-methylenetetrahydrofolate dehydrogenase/5,10-methenyltetrahydrofolate cyclohydrolase [Dethiothermospora halolimnae]|uniref:bifunctional 5,10-methylenetetrahydrofolate dehydrogenase/5,10-methenyltetrahydrofolate cyclohydrolase n=1 Tax=Dethiothermospora halolimnae TaxID=3114390 RepID=UPI003CCBE5B7
MEHILKGKAVAKEIKENIKTRASKLKEEGKSPKLAIVRMGERQDDIAYERGILKNCSSVGIEGEVFKTDRDASMDEFVDLIKRINNDSNIHGILIFRPLPDQIDEEVIKNIINPEKDIDCMNPVNLEKVFEGDMKGFVPCTPRAVIEILKHYGATLEGANVSIINKSLVVGKPLAMMFLEERSTVTICHSRTKELQEKTKASDIVVTATGRAKMFTENYFGNNNIVLDVGINVDENGKMCGDVDYDNVENKVKAITPVPGGVGSVTTSILLRHVVMACENMK